MFLGAVSGRLCPARVMWLGGVGARRRAGVRSCGYGAKLMITAQLTTAPASESAAAPESDPIAWYLGGDNADDAVAAFIELVLTVKNEDEATNAVADSVTTLEDMVVDI